MSAAVVLFNLVISLILQLAIIFVYRKTRHGLSYSRSFVFTVIMIGMLGTSTMLVINTNITGAFALLGAFSLIRFRTILKETSDIAYVFFALIVGVSVGTNHYAIAFITVAFISLVVFIMQKYGFGSTSDNFEYVLIVKAEGGFNPDSMNTLFEKHLLYRDLLQVKNFNDNFTELAYSIKVKAANDTIALINDLKKLPSIKQAELLSGNSTSEY